MACLRGYVAAPPSVGAGGTGRLAGLVGGCIGERVVKNAEIPVLVVPMHADLKR